MASITDSALLGAAGAGTGASGGTVTDIAVGHATSPYISVYPFSVSGGFGVKYSNPAVLPGSTVNAVNFSLTDIALGSAYAYSFTSGVGFGSQFTPASALGTIYGAFISSNFVAYAHQNSPYVSAYPYTTGVGFGTKYSNPASLPPGNPSRAIDYSELANTIVVTGSSFGNGLLAYDFNPATGWGTQYSSVISSSGGYGVAITSSGDHVAHARQFSPYINLIPYTPGVGFGTAYSNPAVLPAGFGRSVSITDTDVAIAHDTSPYVSVYPYTAGVGFGAKYANPASLPPGNCNSVSLKSSLLALAHATSPYVTVYSFTSGVGFGSKYSDPSTLPTGTGYAVAFRVE